MKTKTKQKTYRNVKSENQILTILLWEDVQAGGGIEEWAVRGPGEDRSKFWFLLRPNRGGSSLEWSCCDQKGTWIQRQECPKLLDFRIWGCCYTGTMLLLCEQSVSHLDKTALFLCLASLQDRQLNESLNKHVMIIGGSVSRLVRGKQG